MNEYLYCTFIRLIRHQMKQVYFLFISVIECYENFFQIRINQKNH